MKVAIFGGGKFGQAMAHCLNTDAEILIFDKNPETVRKINHLKCDNIAAYTDTFSLNVDFIFSSLPMQESRNFWQHLKEEEIIMKETPVCCFSKGIEKKTNKVLSEIIREYYKDANISAISGPAFADEMIRNKITFMNFAGKNDNFDKIKSIINPSKIILKHHKSIKGVQIFAAIKNVVAIASGIITAASGENLRAAFLCKIIKEVTLLSKNLGFSNSYFTDISGIGDLILCCTSEKSRNFMFGKNIANDEQSDFLTEGKYTAESLKELITPISRYSLINMCCEIIINEYSTDKIILKIANILKKDARSKDMIAV